MGTQVLRIVKCGAGGMRAMAAHALRSRIVENALGGVVEVWEGQDTPVAVNERFNDLKASAIAGGQRWRKDQVACLDVLLTCSSRASLTPEKHREYLKDAIQWIKDKWPTAEVLTAVLHDDERSPHVQLLLAPLDARGRFNAKSLMGGPTEMSGHQDAFHESVAKKYGLERGERGSTARHIKQKELYGATLRNMDEPVFETVPKVPEAPAMYERMLPGYQAKQKAFLDGQKAAQAVNKRNKGVRDMIIEQAKFGRSMHPMLLERTAARIRSADLVAAKAKQDRAAADIANDQSNKRLQAAVVLDTRFQQKLEIMNTKTAAVMVAKFSKGLAPEYVATLAKNLGIPLVAGKDIPDQVRRAGLAVTLDEAVKLMEKASDGQLVAAAVKHYEQPGDRQQDAPPAPKG